MTPDERDRVLFKLQAGWTREMPDSMLALFAEKLTPLHPERSVKTVDVLVNTKVRRPVWAEFREVYDAQHGYERAVAPPECGICDDGWVFVACEDPTCTRTDHTVTSCPNGCKPMTAEQRQAKRFREDRAYERAARQREPVGVARDPSEPHGGHDPNEPF